MSETREKIHVAAPIAPNQEVYNSAPSEPDDDFWLEQGGKMLSESLPNVRNAANAMISALGVLEAIYLGILGFAKFIPETLALSLKLLFLVPLLAWLIAIYLCIEVMRARRLEGNLQSPSDIREKSIRWCWRNRTTLNGRSGCSRLACS